MIDLARAFIPLGSRSRITFSRRRRRLRLRHPELEPLCGGVFLLARGLGRRARAGCPGSAPARSRVSRPSVRSCATLYLVQRTSLRL